jgi:hypothetical protein
VPDTEVLLMPDTEVWLVPDTEFSWCLMNWFSCHPIIERPVRARRTPTHKRALIEPYESRNRDLIKP